MTDSEDEAPTVPEDWHYEFDDYHSRAAADIYQMIYKSWPKRPLRSRRRDGGDGPAFGACSDNAGPDHESVDFLDGLGQNQRPPRLPEATAPPRPRRREFAGGRVGPVTDPLRRIPGVLLRGRARVRARPAAPGEAAVVVCFVALGGGPAVWRARRILVEPWTGGVSKKRYHIWHWWRNQRCST